LNDSEPIPDYVPPGEPQRWFHSAWFSRGFLVIAGLFFFLPFININCSGQKLATIKGTDLITGTEMVPQKMKEEKADSTSFNWDGKSDSSLFTDFDSYFEQGDHKKVAPNVLAVISLAALVMALIFSFFAKRIPVIISGGFALMAALCLFFIQIQVSSTVESKIGPFNFSPIAFDFTPYYWSCILFMAMAAVFLFVRSLIFGKSK